MSLKPRPVGRRERNKQQKFDRIITAASELFAEYGVDEVTTQQIAEKADIGTGTLFLYAKSKGELLLLVQNTLYRTALEHGRAAAETHTNVLDAVMAIVEPIVECNRTQIENGRTYLREMVFGDPAEPRHTEALAIVAQTEAAIATALSRNSQAQTTEGTTAARVVTAIMFLTMASSVNISLSVDDIVQQIRMQVGLLLDH